MPLQDRICGCGTGIQTEEHVMLNQFNLSGLAVDTDIPLAVVIYAL
jgi:hypothetical protein